MLSHTGEFPHACEHCPKKFRTINGRNRHVAGYHFKVRPHKCPECFKGFYSKNDLRRHLRIHDRDQE